MLNLDKRYANAMLDGLIVFFAIVLILTLTPYIRLAGTLAMLGVMFVGSLFEALRAWRRRAWLKSKTPALYELYGRSNAYPRGKRFFFMTFGGVVGASFYSIVHYLPKVL